MRYRLFLPVLLLALNTYAQKAPGILEGHVSDLATGQPLPGANIVIDGTPLGSAADSIGYYKIAKVPEGVYNVSARYIGYAAVEIKNVNVKAGKSTRLDFALPAEAYELGSVTVLSTKPLINKNVTNSISSPAYLLFEEAADFHTEQYAYIRENDFFSSIEKPLSTFSIDVDDASYSNSRRFISESQLPPVDAVRVEEFINYFDYDYPQPADDKPFSVVLEYGPCPWNKEANLVHIGLKGKQIPVHETKASNLVFLIDVSGSMSDANKLPLVQKAFNMLIDQLGEKDKVAIVVYAGAAGLVLPATSASDKSTIKNAVNQLSAGGSTAGGEGLMLAYKVAGENFIKGGNNRIILATDGDFNVGVSSISELTRFIEEQRDKGIFFTALGFGMGNYKDDLLQQLADNGNGNHAYIDNIMEAKKVFVNDLSSTLYTIAKDVKIQVEFNPVKVKSYRLIGYENRLLNDQDFTDDKKDAGEIGSGHTVTALYEIIPNKETAKDESELKYQSRYIKSSAYGSNELLSLKIRYKQPDGSVSTEYETVLDAEPAGIAALSNDFKFSAAVAQFAMLLRDSKYKGDTDYNKVIAAAKESMGEDKFGYRAEFIDLVERASLLSNTETSSRR